MVNYFIQILMLSEYLEKQLKKAKFKKLKDSSFFGSIPGFPGIWSNNKTLSAAKKELQEVLEEWFFLKIRSKDNVLYLTNGRYFSKSGATNS